MINAQTIQALATKNDIGGWSATIRIHPWTHHNVVDTLKVEVDSLSSAVSELLEGFNTKSVSLNKVMWHITEAEAAEFKARIVECARAGISFYVEASSNSTTSPVDWSSSTSDRPTEPKEQDLLSLIPF